MIAITGIGWLNRDEFGCVMQQQRWHYADLKSLAKRLLEESVLRHPVKGFRRFDAASRAVVGACALALHDARISYSKETKQDIGILGTNDQGSLRTNLDYFEDYVDCGRTLGRANLFIYTLPSTPLAEAAAHFGFQGPFLHLAFTQDPVASMLRYAEEMIAHQEASAMLAVWAEEECAICFVLAQEDTAAVEASMRLEEVMSIARESSTMDMVEILAHAASRIGP